MAAEGMKFTDHYTSVPVCLPTRCCLMTGLHNGHARLRTNQAKGIGLQPEDTTIAKVLKSAGYATGAFGKWAIGELDTPGHPTAQGFDTFFGYTHQSAAHEYYPETLVRDDQRFKLPANAGGKKGAYSHDLIWNEMLGFVRKHQAGPFYAYVPITLPHTDFVVPDDEIRAKYSRLLDKDDDVVYASMVARIDRDMGRLLALLKELDIDENTLVIFDSDNGPAFPGRINTFDSTGPFRGRKRLLQEGGIRVPMIARWPGKIEPGSVCTQPNVGYDFLATFADLAGAKVPGRTDGRSFAPNLMGRKLPERDYLYFEFVVNPRRTRNLKSWQQGARKGKWKACKTKAGPMELYDLEADPGESNDLAARHPELVRTFEKILADNASDYFK
jgi:arylsulfatase A-like enzyme